MDDDMGEYKYIPLGDNVEEMFIGPFGSSLKNECFVEEDEAYCMVYEQKHAIQKTMDVETRYVNEQKYNELKRFNVHGGDIIVSCRGTIGETFIVPDDAPIGIMHPSIMKIRLKEGVYDKYYFNLLLKSRLKKHEVEANGSGIKMAISATELGKELFPVPTMEEQLEITDIISRTSCVIEKRKQELSALDDLIKARFVEMFYDKGYPVLKWNDVFNTTTGKLDSNAAVEDGKYPFFTCSKEALRIDKFAFDQEALLLAGNNAAGKYDVKYYKGKFNAYQRTYVLGLKEDWSYQLFRYQLEDKLVYLQQQSLGGLTKYLTMKILGELEFIIPPMEKQIEFEEFANQVDKSKFGEKKETITIGVIHYRI